MLEGGSGEIRSSRPARVAQVAHIEKFKQNHTKISNLKSENVTLKEQSLVDHLTGLYNRRFFNGDEKEGRVGILESVFKDAQRGNDPLSMLMLDIDKFKGINDAYGHQSGDVILKKVAEVIKTHTRHSDFAVRYGGEEFIVLLPATDVSGAESYAELLRQAVNSLSFDGENLPKNVSISAGVATYIPHISDSINNENMLIYAADKAMYAAKENGRNQTWVAGEVDRPVDQVEKYGKTQLTFHKHKTV